MTGSSTKIGLIGAGYIASWHAEAIQATPGIEVAAICDRNLGAAEALAAGFGALSFGSVEDLIASKTCDAVHILTPPDLHKDLAIECLNAGLNVLVEKPVALSAGDTKAIQAAAEKAGQSFSAGHNFLGLPRYEALKAKVDTGALGRISHAEINWALPLAPLRSGPYGLWLMQETRNLLLELGPHPFSFAVDLFGALEILTVTTGQEITLPGGGTRPQSWRIQARAGHVDINFNLSLVETVDDRSVTLRGSTGTARLDYAADTLQITRDNTGDLVLNPLRKSIAQSAGHLREGIRNAAIQMASLNRRSPYGQSFQGMNRAVYGAQGDTRFSGDAAVAVMNAIESCLSHLPQPKAPPVITGTPTPSVMVIGGTGYIGRNLTRSLVSKGHDVRVLSRGNHGPFADIADHVEITSAPLKDRQAMAGAMEGIHTVYNLAKSMDKSWDAALKNDVGTALSVAGAALDAGVDRLIYTGTIASYDMSDRQTVITEDTEFGDLEARNLYARSKAECEARLKDMAAQDGLPLIIARPGIVVGGDGPLQHWGIGRWHGPGAVKLWGYGRNKLPFVLADELSDGLIAMMETEGVIGESFNLVGDPLLTAHDYFDGIAKRCSARMRVSSGALGAMWAADAVKYGLKRYALGRKDAVRPSLADWKSRAHLSIFDNSHPKSRLGWQVEADGEAFLDRAIDPVALFGV